MKYSFIFDIPIDNLPVFREQRDQIRSDAMYLWFSRELMGIFADQVAECLRGELKQFQTNPAEHTPQVVQARNGREYLTRVQALQDAGYSIEVQNQPQGTTPSILR